MPELSLEDKVDDILISLRLIEDALGIVPDRVYQCQDLEGFLEEYQAWALDEQKLTRNTTAQRVNTLRDYLSKSENTIKAEYVARYLEMQKSPSMYNNALKALKPLCKENLRLGKWIDEFDFKAIEIKPSEKSLPKYDDLVKIQGSLYAISYQSWVLFRLLYCTGLRVNEALAIKGYMVDYRYRCVDLTDLHKGETKRAWFVFFNPEMQQILENAGLVKEPTKWFDISYSTFRRDLAKAADLQGFQLSPKDLRLLFNQRCESVGIAGKYIEAMQGRLKGSSSNIRKLHYTNYSKEVLYEEYQKVSSYLTL